MLRPENWDKDSRIIHHSSKEKDPNSSQSRFSGIYKLEFEDWFVWERQNNRTIKIRLSENKGSTSRKIDFQASVGNPGDTIHIAQNSKK